MIQLVQFSFTELLTFQKIQDYSFTSFENGKLKDISIKVYKNRDY